jgi:hypothetical protein
MVSQAIANKKYRWPGLEAKVPKPKLADGTESGLQIFGRLNFSSSEIDFMQATITSDYATIATKYFSCQ